MYVLCGFHHVSVKCNMCICVYTYQRLHVMSLSACSCNVRVSAHVAYELVREMSV